KLIGFGKVKLIHANDSKGKLGSRIDRHEHIGMGHIGTKGFKALLSNSRVRGLPLIIETPADGRASDVQDLKTLRRLWAIAGEKG
ncbi:MAG: TIM barrel protein, partial [Candidatus Bathyarchaeia archaeon]